MARAENILFQSVVRKRIGVRALPKELLLRQLQGGGCVVGGGVAILVAALALLTSALGGFAFLALGGGSGHFRGGSR